MEIKPKNWVYPVAWVVFKIVVVLDNIVLIVCVTNEEKKYALLTRKNVFQMTVSTTQKQAA